MKRKPVAPIAVEKKIADACFNFSLLALAVYRDKNADRYRDALEEAATDLEDALASSAKWLKPLLKARR